jgi:hypothetical protein
MKASEIVQQLATYLPVLTDLFTTNVTISTLTLSGSTVTAQCDADHNLTVGQQVNVTGAESPISISSLTRSGTVGTLVTDTPHDFTEGFSTTVKIAAAVEAEFVGEFTILSVPNRKTVTFTMADSGATVATGFPLLLNGFSKYQTFNGLVRVTAVPATDQFQYEITTTPPLPYALTGDMVARTKPRISAAVDPARLVEYYTSQPRSDLWAFVVLGDVVASKSRDIQSDATANIQRGNYYRQQLIQPFSVFVFWPTNEEIAARDARDSAEDLFPLICKSLLGRKFDSRLYCGAQNPVVFVDHGYIDYRKSVYIHTYNFQTVADITFNDTIGYGDDVAFRDINLSMGVSTGDEPLTASIDLDDIPL